MIKLIATGLWVCAVTLGATFGAIEWQKRQTQTAEGEPEKLLQEMKSKAINVPIIADGEIQGYIIAQFSFTVDGNAIKKVPVNPEVYLLDEAFRTIYAGEKINFKQLKKQDLTGLAKMFGDNVNKRLGVAMVQEVLIEQLAYVPKKDVRGPPKE